MVTRFKEELGSAFFIDARLSDIEREIDLLLHMTPTNAGEAWSEFERSDFKVAPIQRLRDLHFDPDLVRRELYGLELESVADPAIKALFKVKRDELGRQITSLEDRDTSRFLYGSLQVFGEPSERLVTVAEELLTKVPTTAPTTHTVTAGAFADAARAERDLYVRDHPDLTIPIEVRDDVSELMVSFGRLLIPSIATVRDDRVPALLHHEIGTHVVTYANGDRQPFKLLRTGLPGYDETQEGLAVLSEYVSGGLDPRRMRVLAARVIAVDMMLDGSDLVDIFETLRNEHGFSPRTAFLIASRVHVGGGSARDAIYLRGIMRVLDYLAEGRDLDVLLVGKLSIDHVPLIQDLLDREILQPPTIKPRWLQLPETEARLRAVREGAGVIDLIEEGVAA